MQYPLSVPGLDLYNGKFTDGLPGTRPASVIPSVAINALIDEVLAVIVAAGITPNEGVFTQLRDALNTVYPRLSSAAFTTSPTAPTPVQFDSSTKLATTAALRKAGLQLSGVTPINGTGLVGTTAHVGGEIYAYGAGSSTYSLPDSGAGAIPIGSSIVIVNVSAQPFTVSKQGADTTQVYGVTPAPSFTIPINSEVLATLVGANLWLITGAGAFLKYTLQNVLGSRAAATSYTNSTGRAIYVSVTFTETTAVATTVQVTVNGIVIWGTTTPGTIGYSSTASFWVPDGGTYYCTSAGGTTVLGNWTELR